MEQQTSKYMALVKWARAQIESGEIAYGGKFYTEHALAAMFSISRQTVRQAIGILENEGYLARRQGSGTFVVFRPGAQNQKTMTIGVISTYIDDYIFPSIIRGIEQVLSKNNYSMQLSITHNRVENETRALQAMREKGVDGIIIEPTKSALQSPNHAIYNTLFSQDVPVLFFNASYPHSRFGHVSLNDTAAGYAACEALIAAGHRDIAGFFLSDNMQGHLRYAGYLDALLSANLPLHAERVLWFATEDIPSLFSYPARILERLHGCTAAFCYNDQIAVALVDMLRAAGLRVPQDISIIGIDNSAQAALCEPPLTTVEHPKELLGRRVAENLLRRMQEPTFDATFEFPPHIVQRASVAHKPHQNPK